MIESIIKTTQGTFKAIVDGQELFVPNAQGNRHYQMILNVVGTQDSIPQDDSYEWYWSGTEWVQAVEPITSAMVNVERDRRLQLPFSFQGSLFDRDEKSLARITGAATLAGFALLAQTETTFQWITSTNEIVTLSALDMFNLGKAAADREAAIVFAARQLKDMPSIPEDYISDTYWP